MSLSIDFDHITNGSDRDTNFGSQLLRLIFKADSHNRRRLAMGFPNAVQVVDHYIETGEILDLPYD
jgi:hypothetical protein